MLWEVMFEMLGELFSVVGEIFGAFWGLGKAAAKALSDPKKNQDPVAAAKQKAQLIMIFSILGLVIAIAFMFPAVRRFVFHGQMPPPAMLVETPRSQTPMAQFTTPQLFKKKKMIVGEKGAQRTIFYYLYAPKVAVGQKLPLVVVLHGKDGMDQAAMYLRAGSIQKVFPSYILIPQMPQGKVWDGPAKYQGQEFPKAEQMPGTPAELTYMPDVISELEEVMGATAEDHATLLHSIDDSRLYIIGCDDGGTGVFGAAAHYPGIFAGGVSIAGKWSFLDRNKLAKTPLLILYGAKDMKPVPADFANLMVQVLSAVRGRAVAHVFPGIDHNCDAPDFYAQVVWQWLFSQALPPAPEAPPPAPAPVAATVSPSPTPSTGKTP